MGMKDYRFTIFWSPPGEISEDGVWVCTYGAWMHTEVTFDDLAWSIQAEFKHDKHLVG